MEKRIDYDKSILKQRLIFKSSFWLWVDRILDTILWIILLFCIGFLMLAGLSSHVYGLAVFMMLILIWLIAGFFLMNKLMLIKGTNQLQNRRRIMDILNEQYPKLKLDSTGEKIISYNRNTGLFNWGKKIIVVFHNEDIYINITTFGHRDVKSPIHSVFHYLKLKSLRTRMESKYVNNGL